MDYSSFITKLYQTLDNELNKDPVIMSFSDKYRDVKHENYYINHIFAISLGIAIME